MSLIEACKKFNIKNTSSICNNISGRTSIAGKYPDGTGITWRYI